MKVLLTGATGAIGSHVVRLLLKDGFTVAAIIRPNCRNIWRISDILSGIKIIEGDLSDVEAMKTQICDYEPNTTVHFAWNGVNDCNRNDFTQIQNISFSLNLLKILISIGCKNWIGLGSQAEYGRYEIDGSISEDVKEIPKTLYGTSKYCLGLLAKKICSLKNIRYVWLRLFATYGPADNPNFLIPYAIKSILCGNHVSLTLGKQQWDYLFVEDFARAVSHAIKADISGVYNIGYGDSWTVRKIIEFIRDTINPSVSLGFGEMQYAADQILNLKADISNFKKATNWSPKISMEEGLMRTIDWYRENGKFGSKIGV